MIITEEELKKRKESKVSGYSKFLKFYLMPILATSIFIGIIVFLVTPKVATLIDEIGKVSDHNATIKTNNDKLKDLVALEANLPIINSKLEVINNIAPVGNTKVVEFRDRVFEVASKNNLNSISERFTEVVESSIQTEGTIGIVGLQEVPSAFEFSGRKGDILNFLNGLESIEDFVVLSEMKLTASDIATDSWGLEIELTKYQFKDQSDNAILQSAYLAIPATSTIDSFMDEYIENKLSNVGE